MTQDTKLMYPRYLTIVNGILSEDRFECTIISCGSYPEELRRNILTSNTKQVSVALENAYESGEEILIFVSDNNVMAVGHINVVW